MSTAEALASSQEDAGPAATVPAPLRGVPHTAYDDVDPSFYLGHSGTEDTMVNDQGLRLRRYCWASTAPGPPRAALLFVHGHGAHIFFELLKGQGEGNPLAYEDSWVATLNAAGITVIGIDNQGCGRSEGARGLRYYVESFDDYVADVIQAAQEAEAGPAADLPLFLAGISLGGCISLNAALRRPELFSGVVLLAPMLSLERSSRKGLNPYLRPLATLLSRFIPAAPVVATDRNTLYPDIQALWDADPLTMHGNTRVRNAHEYLRATEAAMAELEAVEFPFLVFHSENDTMCDCDGSKALYLRAASTDKTLRLVNNNWHVLVKEKGNERILAEAIEWILKRAGEGKEQ